MHPQDLFFVTDKSLDPTEIEKKILHLIKTQNYLNEQTGKRKFTRKGWEPVKTTSFVFQNEKERAEGFKKLINNLVEDLPEIRYSHKY